MATKPQKGEQVLRLYEAFLSFPMRLRLSPSHAQICLDSISYGEDLHNAKMVSSDSFFDFAQKVIALFPSEPPFRSLMRRTVEDFLKKNQITFHGGDVSINGIRALLSVAPFVSYVKVSSALKSLEDVSKKLNDQTNISQLMAITSKHYSSDMEAAVGAMTELVECLRS